MTYFRLSRGPATEACQYPALDGCVHREWGVQVSSVADYKATCISCFHLGLISPLPSYIFILYTTFRFNIQRYPFRYHFFTSSAYLKMPGEKVRHIVSHPSITTPPYPCTCSIDLKCPKLTSIARLFASPRTTLHRMHTSLPTI